MRSIVRLIYSGLLEMIAVEDLLGKSKSCVYRRLFNGS